MTRIIAGSFGGQTLKVPPRGTRPTSERVREAVFSRLMHWNLLAGSRVLDLCAGSGALGLEALSRGASQSDFVEMSRQAAGVLSANVKSLGAAGMVHCCSASQFLRGAVGEYDLVFIDPPYALDRDQLAQMLELVAPHLEPHAVVVLEQAKRAGQPPLPNGLVVLDQKSYGDTTIWYLEAAQ